MGLAFVSLMFGTLLRSTILALLCGLVLWLFRVRAADLKHLIWRIVLLALFALPAFQIMMPPLRHMLSHSSLIFAAVAVYLFVTFCFLARLAIGLFRLKRIADQSEFIPDLRLHRLAHDAWLENGARLKPRVRVSNQISVPVAVDLDDVLVLLPRSWQEWNEDKLRAVLTHEMAHIARRDPSCALMASFAVCIFWFHPLSWFLQRQLADLAEEACDDAAIRTISAPQQYARILIDFASEVARQGGRALAPASAAVRSPQLKKRLEHLYACGRSRKTPGPIRALLLAILLPAVYVTAAARFDGVQLQNEADDLKAQQKLLDGYLQVGDKAQFTNELVRLIQHDPDSILAGVMTSIAVQVGGPLYSPETVDAVKSAWERAARDHPRSPGGFRGLGISVENEEPERALKLFQQAQQLSESGDPDRYRYNTARIYAAAIVTDLHLGDPRFRLNGIQMGLNTATKLRNELEKSNDPALLSYVGTILVSLSESPGQDAQSKLGLEYLQRAIDLEPGNSKWASALEAAQAEPTRRRGFAALLHPENPPGVTIRIGAAVASANLVQHVDPEYPPLALQARIQGTVEFNVMIGADGHVTSMRLVRGHPLLVNAAQKAVLQWIYRRTLLNGKPVAVTTEVTVPFQLPH
jgi:TonB family protein